MTMLPIQRTTGTFPSFVKKTTSSNKVISEKGSLKEERMMNLEDLAQRIQVLEDIDAIKKLKARYTGFCDNGYDPDGIASLFTEDAVWDGGVFGGCEGREGIRKVFCEWSKLLPFALQYVFDPIMEIQRDTANGA